MNSVSHYSPNVILRLCFVYTLSLFFGFFATLALLFQWVVQPNSFWHVKQRPVAPPCLNNTEYGTHSYIRLKLLKLHYVENGDRSKPLMLFIHGFPEFWFSWRHQLVHFAKSHWVVALDLRGYGDSDKPPKRSDYSLEILQSDIHDLVKGLGRESCILVSHDWGSIIAFAVASKYPKIVQKLVVMNGPHPAVIVDELTGGGHLRQILKSWYVYVFQLPYLPELLFQKGDLAVLDKLFGKSVTPEHMEAFKYTWAKKGSATPPINFYRNFFAQPGFAKYSKLPRIRVPTLIIWGEEDTALEKHLAISSAQHVEDVRIEFIPKGNHFIQQDKPDKVNHLIQQFIEQ